jgi:hypothetical protein
MPNTLSLEKMSLVVTTRCNLKCKLCDEFIPQHKPFPDMTPEEERAILDALFAIVDRVKLLHLSGGGEPFLHPKLAEMIDVAFEYFSRFDELMVFTNSTVHASERLIDALQRYKDKIIVHASDYGIMPDYSAEIHKTLKATGVRVRIIHYHGENQDYGGWVDFGTWDHRKRTPEQLAKIFSSCGITRFMRGNWRTRDGTVHWCQRSQRGMELGILPNFIDDYVDLFSDESIGQKRGKFRSITNKQYLSACNHCSGNHGTEDESKRFPAGEQLK